MADRPEDPRSGEGEHDPFAPIDASPRFAKSLAVTAFVLAGLTVVTGLGPLTGAVGMALGLIAYVKGSRLGMPAAMTSGAAMILGMAVTMYLR